MLKPDQICRMQIVSKQIYSDNRKMIQCCKQSISAVQQV